MRATPRISPARATSIARRVAELLALVEHAGGDLTELAAGGDDEHDAVTRRPRRGPSMPPVVITSSSGWAWKATRVPGIARMSTARRRCAKAGHAAGCLVGSAT